MEALARFAQEKLGRIDIWVSCQPSCDVPDPHCGKAFHLQCMRLAAEGSSPSARTAEHQLKAPLLPPQVNNAGISQAHKATLQHTDSEELRRVLDTNLLGSIFGARAALQVWAGVSS